MGLHSCQDPRAPAAFPSSRATGPATEAAVVAMGLEVAATGQAVVATVGAAPTTTTRQVHIFNLHLCCSLKDNFKHNSKGLLQES